MNAFLGRMLAAAAFAALAAGFGAAGAWAATQAVPSELVARGREVFEKTAGKIGCAACHGHFGTGDLGRGPNIRSADETRVKNSLAGVGAMRFFTLTAEEFQAVVAFLRHLAGLHPVTVELDDGPFEPAQVNVPGNRPVQFIVHNKGEEPCTFGSPDAGIPEKTVAPGRVDDVVWKNQAKGTYTARCAQRPSAVITIVADDAETAGVSK